MKRRFFVLERVDVDNYRLVHVVNEHSKSTTESLMREGLDLLHRAFIERNIKGEKQPIILVEFLAQS